MDDKFIKIGSDSIRKSNIKSFGVSSYEVEENDEDWADYTSNRALFYSLFKYVINKGKIKKTVRYVYITTYQNDNYRFTDKEIDVNKVIEMLKNNG